MKKILTLVLLLMFVAFAEEESVKNPWRREFQGNSYFSNFQLDEELSTPKEFGNMDTTKQNFMMRLASDELLGVYYSYGFFSARVELNVSKDTLENNTIERVFKFIVTEGERYHFEDLKIIQVENSNAKVEEPSLKVEKGDIYNQTEIAEDLQRINNAYQEQGYLHSTVSYMEKIDTVLKIVHVEVYVNPGTQVKMGNIQSKTRRSGVKDNQEGLSDTAWLNELWRIPQGEVLNGKQSASFKSKLFSTQLFTQVKMEDSLREDGLSDMHLYVQERVPGETRYGMFYEQIYGFGASVGAKHKNIGGHFHELGSSILIAQHKQEVTFTYAHPLLFGTAIQFIPTAIRFDDALSFNHEKITPPAYPDSLEERYEVINRGNLTFGFSRDIRFRGTLDTRYVQKNDDELFKIKLETALTFDFTDDHFNPKKGIRIMPTLGAGTNLTASIQNPEMIGNPYTYGELTTNLYFPIIKTLYGAVSGSYGRFFAKALEDDARAFYQGGSRSIRGYRFRSIYASYESLDEEGETVINTGLTPIYMRVNGELRFGIPVRSWNHWQIVSFYDWAKITDVDSETYEGRTDASLGLGLRYQWQFLTFRLDYAFKKNFSDWNMENFAFGRFAFDLSQAF